MKDDGTEVRKIGEQFTIVSVANGWIVTDGESYRDPIMRNTMTSYADMFVFSDWNAMMVWLRARYLER